MLMRVGVAVVFALAVVYGGGGSSAWAQSSDEDSAAGETKKGEEGGKPEDSKAAWPDTGGDTVAEDDAKAADPKVEDPKVEGGKLEGSKAEDLNDGDAKLEDPKADDPKADDPKADDPKAEDGKAENGKAENRKAEDASAGTEQPEGTPSGAPPPKDAPDAPASVEHKFIKGDLIYPGTRRLLSRFDHVGVALGLNIIENDVYVTVSPGMAWYFDFGFAMSAHVPLQLMALDVAGSDFAFGGLKLRRQDWDEISDFAKIIRFATYGRKEEQIYISINTMRPSTIGHGMLMKNYQGDIDVDRSLTGFVFDAYNDYGGFQLQLNDITFQNRVLAGLGFIKPLSLFMDDVYSRSFSLGGEYIADLRAPRCVRLRKGSDRCVQGVGHAAGFNPFTGVSLDDTFVRTDPDMGRFVVEEVLVHAVGGSVEVKFFKDEAADMKIYGTFHKYLNDGGGDGAAVGLLGRLNVGDEWISAFRLRGEYRTFTDGFMPAYFNTLYEIQKYAYLYEARDFQVGPTKYQQVFGDPENGFARPEHGRRHGFNVDLNWGLFRGKRSAKQLALGLGLQESTGPHDTYFYAHIEFPMLEWLQIFGTFLRPNAASIKDVFTSRSDAIILTGIRLRILRALFINAHYSQSFRVKASPGIELHLGNDRIVDGAGEPSPFFNQDNLFERVHTVFAELEFGWEFSND